MIISNIRLNKKGIQIVTQRVKIRCDKCNSEYESSILNRNAGLEKYDIDLCRSCKQKEQYKSGVRKEIWTKVNKRNKGKTFEERFGKEKGKKYKEDISKRTKGKNNPKWSLKYHTEEEIDKKRENVSEFMTKRFKGKTYDEIYGKEKSKIIRKKLSECRMGEKNPMFGKPSPKGSGNGWSGYYLDYYFRSFLEMYYIHYLYKNDINFVSAETKDFVVKYTLDNKQKTYHPDFYLIESDTIIEVKPKSLLRNKINFLKFEAAKKKFKNFEIITEDDIDFLPYEIIKDLYASGILKLDKSTEVKFNKYV